jgi:hypothetical protein
MNCYKAVGSAFFLFFILLVPRKACVRQVFLIQVPQ